MFPTADSLRTEGAKTGVVACHAMTPVDRPPAVRAEPQPSSHITTLQTVSGQAASTAFGRASADVADSMRDSTGKGFMAHAMHDPDLLRIALGIHPGARTAE